MNRPIYINFFILLLSSCLSSSYAQSDIEQILVRTNKHILDAEKYYAEMQYVKAKESYQFAARLYRNNNLPAYYAICYNGIGNIYIELTLYEDAKNKGFEKALQQLAEIKSIDPKFKIDSSLVADAYEGLGRYYSSISTTLKTNEGLETKIHYKKALEYHQAALAIRRKLDNEVHQKVALSYYYIGRCYRGFSSKNNSPKNDFTPIQKELEYLNKALDIQLKTIGKIHYQTANTYQALGNFFYETQKDYHKGFSYHQKAFEIRNALFDHNHLQIASSYIDIAIYYRVMNIYDNELKCLEKALKIQLNTLGTEHVEVAKSYYLLANRYRNNGSLDKARSYYEYALVIFEKLKHKQSLEIAEVRLALALCFRTLKEENNEWQELQKSKKIYETNLGDNHLKLAPVFLEIGNYYLGKKAYDSTLFFYQKALAINQQQLGRTHYSVTNIYEKIATIYRLQGIPEKEFSYLMQALEIKQDEAYLINESRVNQPSNTAQFNFSIDKENRNRTLEQQLYSSYMSLANFYQREKEQKQALQYIQKALAAVCPSIANQTINIYTNPTTEDLSHNIEWLGALEQKANLIQQLYYKRNRVKDLKFAIQTYRQGIDVINSLRTNFSSTEARQELMKYSLPVYEGAITALYLMYQQTEDAQYLDQAFEVTEYSKTFALLQGLQNTLARGGSNIPLELLEAESTLRSQLAYYSNYKNRNAKDNQEFDKAYLITKQSYDSLIFELERKYPTYYKLKYEAKITSLDEIQAQLLQPKQVLLEYFVGDKYIYVFKISPYKKDFFQLPMPSNYEQLVYNLRSALTNYDMIAEHPQWAYQAFVSASHKFYLEFFAPLIHPTDQIEEITIIPDGMLNYIPFEVLIEQGPEEQEIKGRDYKKLAFILKKYAINYNYSSTLWIKNIQENQLQNNGKCLGFAPSIQFATNQDSLPWTQKELEAIEAIFDGEYYYGEEANKALFKNVASKFSIIHLATHGIVNMDNPMRSLLSFASSDTSNKDNAALYAYEIHNLSINADLVVLSACETGFGKAVRGEGVLSLARAFLYAGAPSVVTTLWEVNDFTSAALIETFYSNLATGMSKSIALQQAKLTFLSKTDNISGHPTYWASFISIGNSAPIKRNPSWWFIIGIVASSPLVLFLLFRIFRKY
jgi:CHAT domain-containing protein/tetratricopeptide (TPR) repeat protein